MRRFALLVAVLALPAGTAAAAPKLELMVVGKDRVLQGPRAVPAGKAAVRVGGKRCRVAARTPLAALLRAKLRLAIKDFGSCGRRPADAGALYVRSVAGERERGAGGWVFKVGNETLSTGAGDLDSRVRAGGRVLWFWCKTSGACQRTLAVRPAARAAAPGSPLRVRVRAYDDYGRAEPAAGATVRMGTATAVADADGVATLTAPARPGTLDVVATKAGTIRSFPAEVRVR